MNQKRLASQEVAKVLGGVQSAVDTWQTHFAAMGVSA
jgi:hypothetical protein